MKRVATWLGRHRLLVSALIVSAVLAVLAGLALSTPGIDRVAYASPLARAPEAVKARLRPLRAPKVDAVVPAENAKDVLERAPVTVAFTTPMNKEATQAAVRFEPAIPGHFSWADERTLIFTPEADWPSGGTVHVYVGAQVRSSVLRSKDAEFTSQFDIVGPPAIVGTSPAAGARFAAPFKDAGISITFSRAMDEKSVTDRVRVAPPLQNMRFGWVQNKLFIYGVAQPSTTYLVSLEAGARDKVYGLAMADGFQWTFTTTRMMPSLGLLEMGRYGQFSAYGPKKQDLSLLNVSGVQASLFTIDIPTYLKLRGFTYDDWRSFRSEKLPLLRSWPVPFDAVVDQRQTVSLDLGDLQPGIYMLLMTSAEEMRDSQVILVSKAALTLKRTDRQALAWATDMQSGLPVPGMSVTFYNPKGEKLASGTTDNDGLLMVDIAATTGLVHALAGKDGDLAAASSDWQSGVEPWRFSSIQWQWQPGSKDYNVFIYTDRPLYRPAQTVNFKGIVRADADGVYSQPPAGSDVYLQVANWDNQVLYKKTLKTTAFGSFNDSFTINPEAKLGDYQIRVEVGKEPSDETRWQYQASFRVEEYRKPEYSVSVRTDKTSYINGDTVNVSISAQYFFGAPAPNAKVRYTVYTNDYWFSWNRNEDFDFGLGTGETPVPRFYYGKDILSREAQTDASGNLVLRLPADISQEQRSQLYIVEATVMDSSNQPVSGTATAIVHRGTFYIGAQPESWVATAGKECTFKVQTVDVSGQPAPNLSLTYLLERVEWQRQGVPSGPKGTVAEWKEVRTKIAQGNLRTAGDGAASLPFTPPNGGSYELTLQGTDERGNRVLGQAWLWVSDREFVNWKFDNNDRIEVRADKRRYKPGESARLLISSPYKDATALVTTERGRIINSNVMQAGNSTVLDVPIDKSFFPNVYIAVVLVPRGAAPSFKVGYAELRVDLDENNLQVSVKADKPAYKPGDSAVYTVKTADSAGKPVSAELSVGVIDAALLALTNDTSRDIVSAYYGRRNLSVQTAGNMAVLLDRVNVRKDWGGGDATPEQQVRKVFPDTAYWNPVVTTDASGTAQVKVTLPDNLTTWRAFAKGITADTKVGSATGDIVVNKDLIVRPVLPRFLTVGDQVTLGAIVHNYTGKDAEVTVSLSAGGVTMAQGGSEKKVRVANGASTKLEWPATANRTDSAKITVRASAGAATDGVETTLPVLPFGERVVETFAGQTQDNALATITLPKEAIFPTLRVEAAPSLAAGLIESLQYLTGFPYGCIEQTMSRFLPDVLVKQTLDKLGVTPDEKLAEELPKQVEDGLTRLYGFQLYDGGWGWWNTEQSDPRLTAYVVYGLIEARRAGYSVNDTVLKRGARALRQPLADSSDPNLKAYLTYVLSEYGEGDISLARALWGTQRSSLTIESRAYLAQAFRLVNAPADAKAVLDEIVGEAVQSASHAHWEESLKIDRYMMSDGRTTAIVLQALMRIDPANPVVPKTVRWLMDNRKGGYWRTTQETAATIIALTEYMQRTGELDFSYIYRLSINGKQADEKQISGKNIAERTALTIKDVPPGQTEIKLSKEGQGTLYYSGSLQYYLERDRIAAATAQGGPSVVRTYRNPDTGRPVTSVKAGDLVQVVLTVTVRSDLWFTIIEDPLPAGTESVNQSLRTSAIKDAKTRSYYVHPEYRDSKTAFFANAMWPGEHVYSYMLRATTPGTFRVAPAEAYPMYIPETWGRSDSAVLTITP